MSSMKLAFGSVMAVVSSSASAVTNIANGVADASQMASNEVKDLLAKQALASPIELEVFKATALITAAENISVVEKRILGLRTKDTAFAALFDKNLTALQTKFPDLTN